MARPILPADGEQSWGTKLRVGIYEVSDRVDQKADLVGGKIPTVQLPSLAVVEFHGEVANQTGMLTVPGQAGDWVIRTDTQTVWIVTGDNPAELTSWTELEYPSGSSGAVTTVNGQTGSVTLSAADVGAMAATYTPAWSSITGRPLTFTPAGHSHAATDISDSTTIGQSLVKAADAATARTAIAAASSTHNHAASTITVAPSGMITATNVQDALVQAAASSGGSGSGTSALLVWRYTSGAWPTLPTTKPAGVYEVHAIGPSYPPAPPSWTGLAADKVPMSYSKVAVT